MNYLLIFSLLFLASCGGISRSVANLTGYATVCVNNIEFLQFPSGVVPSYKFDELGNLTVNKCK